VPAPKPTSKVKSDGMKKTPKIIHFVLRFVEEIFIIIEFCPFGNLKSFLIKNRNKFINELNAIGNMLPENETGDVDITPAK
jgi:hypothetical protein